MNKPITESQQRYYDYLLTPTWWFKREDALSRDGHRCRICNSGKSLAVHHRKYPAHYGSESLDDLTTLCQDCHDLFHAHKKMVPSTKKKKKQKIGEPFKKARLTEAKKINKARKRVLASKRAEG